MLRQLPPMTDPALLVGPSTGDDAAVYRLTDELALVQTVDFFPPIVDDPFAYGEIAAANAISDVYAMGGTPMLALNVAAFPVDLPVEVLGEVMRGAASKAAEAGVIVVGGHTVDDQEPKFGMAVTGVVEPGREVTNAGARPGDALVLTKPIGTGVITTAAKQDRAAPEVLAGAVECMGALNRDASHAMVEVGANACVDVTGFGLIGHLLEITRASSGVSAEVSLGAVPVLEGVRDLLGQGIAPGGTRRNLASADRDVDWDPALGEDDRLLLCDAQTSGGLLIGVEAGRAARLVEALEAHGVSGAAIVGRVLDEGAAGGAAIRVMP